MNRKIKITLGAALAAGLLVASVGGMTLAASPANDTGTYAGGNGTGICSSTGTCAGIGYNTSSDGCEAVCDLLGITQDELQSLRQDGLSLVEIAASYGVTEDELVEAIMAVKTAYVQEQVANGTITQEQADLMLQNMLARTYEMINATGVGHFGGNQNGNQNGTGNSWGECSDGTGPGDAHQWGKNAR
jgi:hypothetical protein